LKHAMMLTRFADIGQFSHSSQRTMPSRGLGCFTFEGATRYPLRNSM